MTDRPWSTDRERSTGGSGATGRKIGVDRRAVSETLGYILVFSIIVTTISTVSVVGFTGLEDRQAAEQAQGDVALIENNAEAIFNDGYSWVGGNPEGDVTIVEFFDYRCGFCRRAHPEVAELLELDGNIRYVAKELPILGENSVISSRFALAVREVAGDQAYEAAKEALIVLNGDLDDTVLQRLANTLGLDADAVIAAMDSPDVTEQLANTRALAQALQINGTPSFVMGDQLIRGYVPLEAMQEIVADARQEG